MAAQLRNIARFDDTNAVKNFLFPHLNSEPKKEENEATEEHEWDELEFGWEVEDMVVDEPENEQVEKQQKAEPSNNEFAWLQHCHLSVSPTLEILILARDNRLCVMNQKWDTNAKDGVQTKFSVNIQEILRYEEGGNITDIFCLPLFAQKRSSSGGPDWTCIIVGFSTGYVRFYTETGVLLLSQLLHEDPVLKIRCKTYTAPRYVGASEQLEELTILYKSALVTIDGFSLFQTLRACRNQVARAAASGSEAVQPPPMEYKKWGLQNQDQITDHCSPGIVIPNAFDQMLAASMLGGFHASIKSSPPVASVYATAGKGPTVGFYYAIEGSAQPLLSEVATAIASKLRTALFSAASGFFRMSGTKQVIDEEKRKPRVEPSTPLPIRFGLPDKLRRADTISLSPNNKLLVTTDVFARIMLVDVHTGCALRMWKGYRDAQVAWMEVKEEIHSREERHRKHKGPVRAVLFLLIYAPRRGIIEVWTPEQGVRVAAFNVNRGCRLLGLGYSLLGLNSANHRDIKATVIPCVLIDPDGGLKIIEVPFHLALSDKNSRKARDLHLLKKLKVTLKDTAEETDEFVHELSTSLKEIRTPALRLQAVQKILDTRFLSSVVMETVLTLVIENSREVYASLDEGSKPDVNALIDYCESRLQLVRTYDSLLALNAKAGEEPDSRPPQELLTECLGLTVAEAENLLQLIDTHKASTLSIQSDGPHVSFKDGDPICLSKFLSCFDGSENDQCLVLKSSLQDKLLSNLAHLLYERSLSGCTVMEDLHSVLVNLRLPPSQLLLLLMHFLLSGDGVDLPSIPRLKVILQMVTAMDDSSQVVVDHSELSPWWEQLRAFLSQASNAIPALLVAMVGRTLAADMVKTHVREKMEKSEETIGRVLVSAEQRNCCGLGVLCKTSISSTDDASVTSDWENVSMDQEQWNVLIGQLEHVTWLSCLLRWRTTVHDSQLTSVSVHGVLEGGRGVFAELVSKWVVAAQIRPDRLILTEEERSREATPVASPAATPTGTPVQSPDERDDVRAIFALLCGRLPLSLEQDTVMANCCWEFAAEWNRDPDVINNLKNCLDYLKLVQNAVLKHGLCMLLWNTFLTKRMKTATDLVEKTGRALVNLRHRKELGVKDQQNLTKFFSHVTTLVDVMATANCDADSVEAPSMELEDLWQELRGQTPLVDLACDQAKSNYGLVKHHHHLCVLMEAVHEFNMKQANVLSLFDTKGRNAFFKPLNSHPLLPSKNNMDVGVVNKRRLFLSRLVSQAVQALAKSFRESGNGPKPGPQSPLYHKWTRMTLSLADELDVDVDSVRMHHVCDLYSYGYDKMAEEVLLGVQDHSVMGSMLVLIAGRRLAHFLFNCDPIDGVDNLARLSPTMTTWLKSLDPYELKCPNASISDTATLIGHVVNQLPEAHSSYSFAISMVELVQNFT